MELYSIKDTVSGSFSFPMGLKNQNVAIRYFRNFLDKIDFPHADYQLFKLGVMNEESGEIFTEGCPLFVEGGLNET